MKTSITIVFLLITGIAFGQAGKITKLNGSSLSVSDIDGIVNRLIEANNVQGLNLAILNKKKAVFVKSYGFRNKPQNLPLNENSIFYAASLSKAVFGYLVMKLVEEKIIDLDKPLYQYLKKPISEYEYFADLATDERWKLISARMCLSHTTGLPNVRWFHPITGVQDTIGVMKIYFTPGSKYAYSGEGFKLLQLVIEEITQTKIDALAESRIYQPFGMTRTGYVWHESFGDENVAVGHLNNGLIDLKRKRTEAVAGGSLVTTLSDYTKFTEAMMQQKGLPKKLFNEMISQQIAIHSVTQFPPITFETTTENDDIHLGYGLGWGLLKCPYGRAFFKEGNGDSWRNYSINFIDKGISIIVLTNSENGENIFQELIESLLGDTCIPWKWNGYLPLTKK